MNDQCRSGHVKFVEFNEPRASDLLYRMAEHVRWLESNAPNSTFVGVQFEQHFDNLMGIDYYHGAVYFEYFYETPWEEIQEAMAREIKILEVIGQPEFALAQG